MQLAQPPKLAAAIFMLCFWRLTPVFLKKYYNFVSVKVKDTACNDARPLLQCKHKNSYFLQLTSY